MGPIQIVPLVAPVLVADESGVGATGRDDLAAGVDLEDGRASVCGVGGPVVAGRERADGALAVAHGRANAQGAIVAEEDPEVVDLEVGTGPVDAIYVARDGIVLRVDAPGERETCAGGECHRFPQRRGAAKGRGHIRVQVHCLSP
jgi:hypothetical protein